MTKDPTPLVRGVAVILMSLVTVFHIIGGIGAICVSFGGPDYPPAKAFLPYQHIYQPITILVLILGFVFVIVTYAMFRGEPWANWTAIILMIVSAIPTYYRMQVAVSFRGSSAPTSVRFYFMMVALVYMLLITLLPTIRKRVNWTKPLGNTGSYTGTGGMAMMVAGLVTATSPWWVASTHTIDGFNYAMLMAKPLVAVGGSLMLIGAGLLLAVRLGMSVDEWVAGKVRRVFGIRRAHAAAEGGRQ